MHNAKQISTGSGFSQTAMWLLRKMPTERLPPGCADCCLFAHFSSITSLFAIKILYAQHYFRPRNLEDQHRASKQVLGETALLNFNPLLVKGRPS